MTPATAHKQAAKRSLQTIESVVVVEIDKNDTRETTVMTESDTWFDEFTAFDGQVVAMYANGNRVD